MVLLTKEKDGVGWGGVGWDGLGPCWVGWASVRDGIGLKETEEA